MKKFLVCCCLLSSTTSFAAELPSTVGQARILGVKSNYNVSGVLSYNHGFVEQESGIYNSKVQANLATTLGNGVDVVGAVRVGSDYSFKKDKNEVKAAPSVRLMKDNHQITVGYDKHIANSIFSSVVATNEDAGFTHNLLSPHVSSYSPYLGYSVTIQSVKLSTSVDLDGDYYAGTEVPVLGGDLAFSLYSRDRTFGGYVDYAVGISETANVSFGVGSINKQLASVLSFGKFFNDDLYTYANAITYGENATATAGLEYSFGNLSLYAEGTVDVFGDVDENTGASIGAKLFF